MRWIVECVLYHFLMSFSLLDEYRELYELQRARLEAQIHQLTLEKELWSSATYDIALKVPAETDKSELAYDKVQ